ncbi:MAG: hypothetical protein FWD72_00725 [Eggerthellaceae bacterium]|nr:hypothetical protein [Eggerthellaceae bacterium]
MENIQSKISMENVLSVDYEVFQDCINNEIGYHFGQLYALGESSPQGMAHLKAVDLLEKLRKTTLPGDTATMDAFFITLEATKIGREGDTPEAMSA